jgi:uncharacterized membrane protein YsdA (DUF1294 family)
MRAPLPISGVAAKYCDFANGGNSLLTGLCHIIKMARVSLAYLTLSNIVTLMMLINLITFMLFGIDKLRAEADKWRVSEGTLLFWAFFGGSLGAYCGRALFRHKTRKQPFSNHLHQTAIFHAMIIAISVGLWFG